MNKSYILKDTITVLYQSVGVSSLRTSAIASVTAASMLTATARKRRKQAINYVRDGADFNQNNVKSNILCFLVARSSFPE